MAINMVSFQRRQEKQTEPRESALDLLMKGLQVAGAATGIYANVQQGRARGAEMEQAETLEAERKAENALAQQNRVSPKRLTEMYEKGLVTPVGSEQAKDPSVLKLFVAGQKGEPDKPIFLRQALQTRIDATAAEGEAKRASEAATDAANRKSREDIAKRAIEMKKEAARIAKERNKTSRENATKEASANEKFKNLPPDVQKTILDLGTRRGNIESVVGGISANIDTWDDPKATDKERLQQGYQMLKLLNSLEGADAVAEGEASRLMGKLQVAYGNFSNDQPTQFGRDLEGFRADIGVTLNTVLKRRDYLNSSIEKYYGNAPKPGITPQAAQPKGTPQPTSLGINKSTGVEVFTYGKQPGVE